MVIFTAYKDTADYLFNQLNKRGFQQFAMVSGDENKIWNESHSTKKHEIILERFAPFTKLFREKNWITFAPSRRDLTDQDCYIEWNQWIKEHQPEVQKKIDNPIDILIATDVLSEGQNLQDADLVINYDIHWNPVRVIQRVGRIDRIGSPNAEIQSINFWPAADIDDYINLKARVERRMAMMKLAGSEVINDFTEDFNAMAEDENLEDRQNANMLRQMENTLEDLEDKALGFDDFSFDHYRELLQRLLSVRKAEFETMPNAVFSGFKLEEETNMKPGLVALLGFPAQKRHQSSRIYTSYELIYIDLEGNQISNNQKVILDQLQQHHLKPRFVDNKIDPGDAETLEALSKALRKWVDSQAKTEIILEDGTKKELISKAGLDLINRLKTNPKEIVHKLKTEGTVSDKYQFDKFDLVTWLIIS